MNTYVPNKIVALPLTTKEKHHTSQMRQGKHILISRFYYEYSLLSDDEKLELFNRGRADDASFCSVDSIVLLKVMEVMAMARQKWNALDRQAQHGWHSCAVAINSHPQVGRFLAVPTELHNQPYEYSLQRTLELEWPAFVKSMRPVVTCNPRNGISQKSIYVWRREGEIAATKV